VTCETNINDCEGKDCGNGMCIDGVTKSFCQCPVGRIGSACNKGTCTQVYLKNEQLRLQHINSFKLFCHCIKTDLDTICNKLILLLYIIIFVSTETSKGMG